MTPAQFIALWQHNPLSERAGAQGHFDDLCELLGVNKPRDSDNYCFERGAGKASGGAHGKPGWADVWKRGHFGCHKPSKSLHRMLSPRGNPSMDNLAAISSAIRNWLKVTFDVRVVETVS